MKDERWTQPFKCIGDTAGLSPPQPLRPLQLPFFRNTVFLLSQNYLFQIGVIDTGLESVFTIGCATAACEKGTVTEDGLSVIGCCTGDRCLPQALISSATQLKIARILCVLFAVIGLSRV